ncbi:MAG: hypothetical protein JWP92_3313 [Caulobacter sp.]|nr:hypothetical protein [Caulobacter sp.]
MRRIVLAACLVALAAPAAAQQRLPEDRRRLLDLAYVLGESHALRQACAGQGDDYWRARMTRLAQVEQGDPDFDAGLRERFNSGYETGRDAAGPCGPASRKAEREAAGRGQALARGLSQAVRPGSPPADPATPDSVAELAAPR